MDGAAIRLSLAQGETLLEGLLGESVALEHECGGTLACASCRVIVREGLEKLDAATEDELDMLERAGTTDPGARLACQARGAGDVVLEIPGRIPAPAPTLAGRILPVLLTEAAARHFSAQLAKHPGAVAVRLRVQPSGCSGFGYRVDPADRVRPGDVAFESRGIRVVVDSESLPRVQGTMLDIVQEGLARRLRFDNPNARSSCGCGESFGVWAASPEASVPSVTSSPVAVRAPRRSADRG
jgi:iron-sulfur cluster assembly protein